MYSKFFKLFKITTLNTHYQPNVPIHINSIQNLPSYKQLNINQTHQLSSILYKLQTLNLAPHDNKQLNLLVYLTQRLKPITSSFNYKLAQYIVQNKIRTNAELDVALKYLKAQAQLGLRVETLDWNIFENLFLKELQEEELGILKQRILDQVKDDPLSIKKNTNLCNQMLANIRNLFTCIPSQVIYQNFNSILENQCKQCTPSAIQSQKSNQYLTNCEIYDKIKSFSARDIYESHNTQERIQEHLKFTEGKAVLRFPPEPNGYLHLGHVRSIRLNFYSAEKLEGFCNLRYDDTNPANEKQVYIDQIQSNIQWFGHKPTNITYASDYFQQLFDLAIQLIRQGKAYICEQSKNDIFEFRKSKQASPYRNRSIEQNLLLFQEMQQGLHKEGNYTLRLKIDPEHCNPTLRDPVIYRVLNAIHPRTGDKWKVYPMYDFAHCICDSLENITHSLCTLEFEIRRELYYWILNELEMYKPTVFEFSRLNVSHNLLSKRKIQKLIEANLVEGWDDPRLLTLSGLKKRGYTPSALNEFIDLVSVSRTGNDNLISIKQLESCIRKELEQQAIKLMAIVDPVKAVLNFFVMEEGTKQRKCRQICLEKNDIRVEDNDDFYGLAPNKVVCLRYFGVVRCESIVMNENGQVEEVQLELISEDKEERRKLKG